MAFEILNSILSTTVSITYTCCCKIVLMFYNGLAMHRMKHSGIWGIGVVSTCTDLITKMLIQWKR